MLCVESVKTKMYVYSLFGLQRLAKEAEKYQASHQWRDEFGVSFIFSPVNLLGFILFEILTIFLQVLFIYPPQKEALTVNGHFILFSK